MPFAGAALVILLSSAGPRAQHPSPWPRNIQHRASDQGCSLSTQSCVTQGHSLDLSVPQFTCKIRRMTFPAPPALFHRV